jgi:hypothetical protein|tara:strand:+ start:1231 stop:1464 length:234 start_codon:yes stop_codon:yes gene_type:complete
MEENQKNFKILSKCAEIAEIINTQKTLQNPSVNFKLNNQDFLTTLKEVEEFVRVRVDRTQNQVSINISGIEFIFQKI